MYVYICVSTTVNKGQKRMPRSWDYIGGSELLAGSWDLDSSPTGAGSALRTEPPLLPHLLVWFCCLLLFLFVYFLKQDLSMWFWMS